MRKLFLTGSSVLSPAGCPPFLDPIFPLSDQANQAYVHISTDVTKSEPQLILTRSTVFTLHIYFLSISIFFLQFLPVFVCSDSG